MHHTMEIGEQTYSRGEKVTVTTEPFELHGGMFQNAVDDNGKVYTLMVTESLEEHAKMKRQEWLDRQAGFSRLKKLTNQ